MCELHTYKTTTLSQADRYDPTRTTTLRNAMVREGNRRFESIAQVVRKAVDTEDVLGIKRNFQANLETPGQRAFEFFTNPAKVEEFLKWLQDMVKRGILTIEEIERAGSSLYPIWTDKYIEDAYKRGIIRARAEMIKAGLVIPSISMAELLPGTTMIPVHVDRVKLLYTRAYSELKGITAQMEKHIAQILAQGMIEGEHPYKLARKMVAAINGSGMGELGLTDKLGRFIPAKRRAEMLARTEIIRAHHLGAVQEYRNWGILDVLVLGEFISSHDQRVCPECASLDGRRFPLDEVEGMIPVHPNCRCSIIPYVIKKGGN
jgi:SPP1 gp7 family putative phage head morphogenesis protein